jgi:hypothetical protein
VIVEGLLLAQQLQAFADHCAVFASAPALASAALSEGAPSTLHRLRSRWLPVRGLCWGVRRWQPGAMSVQSHLAEASHPRTTGDIDVLVARRGAIDEFAAALSGFHA